MMQIPQQTITLNLLYNGKFALQRDQSNYCKLYYIGTVAAAQINQPTYSVTLHLAWADEFLEPRLLHFAPRHHSL